MIEVNSEFLEYLRFIKKGNDINFYYDEIELALNLLSDGFTKGYFTRELEILGEGLSGIELMEEFEDYVDKCV